MRKLLTLLCLISALCVLAAGCTDPADIDTLPQPETTHAPTTAPTQAPSTVPAEPTTEPPQATLPPNQTPFA